MAEEETVDQQAPAAANGKSDLAMYLIVGGSALVVTVGAMMAFGDLSGGDVEQSAELIHEAGESTEELADSDDPELPDLFSELDNLDFLNDTDFTTGAESIASELKQGSASAPVKMSKDDSLAALSWLDKEKALLREKEKELNAKEKKLAAVEHEVDQKLKKVDQVEANRLSGLAKLYDGMKHDQVARMLVKLKDETIVQILPRMKTANASKILGLLPADRGARISRKMITLSAK